MRIVFCGTPEYAVPSLKKLRAAHEIVAVVSQPDRAKGRNSKRPTPPPVVEAALALGIPREKIFQPRSINKPDVLNALRALQPDILCVIAYGNILKADALGLGKHFPINAHASLLPKHRGAAPIQAAILAGDSETGVCIIKMEAGLDAGPVLLRRAIPIEPHDTGGSLHDKLAVLSADCFVEALEKIARGDVMLEAQDDSLATYAPKLEKSSGTIDWKKPAVEIERLVRAMTPWPGAWTQINDKNHEGKVSFRVRVVEAAVTPEYFGNLETPDEEVAGASMSRGTGKGLRFEVLCGARSVLSITRIQPEGKREMTVGEFLNGGGKALSCSPYWGRE